MQQIFKVEQRFYSTYHEIKFKITYGLLSFDISLIFSFLPIYKKSIISLNSIISKSVPINIPFDRKFEIEGEAIITQSDFEKINTNGEYKNCRNLASGSVRQLDSNITKNRHVRFIAWKIPFGVTTYSQGFEIAAQYGFEVVPYVKYNSKYNDIGNAIEVLKDIAKEKSLPMWFF